MIIFDKDIWVNKYNPQNIDDYVFKNDLLKAKFIEIIENKNNKKIPLPHLGFFGNPGTGKSSGVNLLLSKLNIDKYDILEINASRENKVETVNTKIMDFSTTWPNGDYKVIILQEADMLSFSAQNILRDMIESYSDTVRYIFTGNHKHKIQPAILSRLQVYIFDSLNEEEFINKIINILNSENIEYEIDQLIPYIDKSYPDLRKCINLLEQHTINKKLNSLSEDDNISYDYLIEAMDLFKKKKFKEARLKIINNIKNDEYENIYRYFYENLDIFSDISEIQDNAIIIIANGLKDHFSIADSEINLSSTMVRLSKL